ncbi:NACHT domain-containing protein [Kitasatospora sp. NPDC058406]|uniref:NACHT domain-containing protein n=1 Tax=Kitasatospora sp. NPDC058406 TaxID=3346483 RepID=UPI00365946AA
MSEAVPMVELGQSALVELKERLRRLRTEQRLSMAALERRTGLGHTTVSQALNGPRHPSEATLVALARSLAVDPSPLLELRRQALPASPVVTETHDVAGTSADRTFEERYRRYVVERHGQLSIVGLDLSGPERACWPLDAAYLSLELSAFSSVGASTGLAGPGEVAEVQVKRAEQALAGLRRTLVRGLAGSGKTTLLQWLAVSVARHELPQELAHLSGCLPFVLPLRTLMRRGQKLPAPQELLGAVGCPLDAVQPPGWADRVLASGKGLLLVDGLDEVPQERRAHTRAWLREVLAAYPQVGLMATTRPSAVPEGWLADYSFSELTVHPMSARDVAAFVARWHAAAASSASTDQERAHLAGLEEALKDTVRAQRALSQLATTPLLCALMCALHRDRRGHLPQGRMELYEAALSVLLVRRDRERDIDAPEGIVVTEHESIQLLQRLAYWLIRNGQTEMDYETALALVDDALPAMPQVSDQGDAAAVLAHLLGRSGLLRMPTADSVDFVHRTFQDYLGAKAAVESHDLPLLVRHAHDDQWEDVLRMAVGHARPRERASLLRRLLARGSRSPRHRTRLHLLATACLEVATELDPVVREEVQSHTAALLPPRSPEEAQELATVGPVILDLLPGPVGIEDDEAEAVIRTAGLIGGDAAMTVMKKFRACAQDQVKWELQFAWGRFDAADYAREILGHISEPRLVTVTSAEQLDALKSLKTPPHVIIRGDLPSDLVTASIDPRKVEWLAFHNNSTLRSLGFIRPYTGLRDLTLLECHEEIDISALADSGVSGLHLLRCDLVGVEGLERLTGLERLSLDTALSGHDLDALPVRADLAELYLGPTACAALALHGITRWPRLTSLSIGGPVAGLAEAATLPNLEYLFLQGDSGISIGADFPIAPQVRFLFLGNYTGQDDLELFRSKFPRIQTLTIGCSGSHRTVDISQFRGIPDLAIRILGATEVLGAEHFPTGSVTRTPRPRS